jgi:cell division protein FtsQ
VSARAIALPLLRPVTRGPLLRRAAVLAAVLAALAAGYWLWLRDSSLVAVRNVEVVGIGEHSQQDRELRAALTGAAKEMTTLHAQPELLERAAARFPLVRSVSASPGFPSSMTVHVVERVPAGLIGSGSGAVAVAADGTILRGLPAERLHLAQLPLDQPPRQDRVRGTVLEQARVLGAVPGALRRYLAASGYGDQGVVVELTGGIELRFGSAAQAPEKWRAAAAVLADPSLTALDYVDLSAPARPSVGGAGHLLPTAP